MILIFAHRFGRELVRVQIPVNGELACEIVPKNRQRLRLDFVVIQLLEIDVMIGAVAMFERKVSGNVAPPIRFAAEKGDDHGDFFWGNSAQQVGQVADFVQAPGSGRHRARDAHDLGQLHDVIVCTIRTRAASVDARRGQAAGVSAAFF